MRETTIAKLVDILETEKDPFTLKNNMVVVLEALLEIIGNLKSDDTKKCR